MNNILFNDSYYNTRENVCIGGWVKMYFLNIYFQKQ